MSLRVAHRVFMILTSCCMPFSMKSVLFIEIPLFFRIIYFVTKNFYERSQTILESSFYASHPFMPEDILRWALDSGSHLPVE